MPLPMAQPPSNSGRAPWSPPDDLPHEQILARARAELEALTLAHGEVWHLDEATWKVDLDTGRIVFTHGDLQVTAPMQIVGSYVPRRGEWMWGWQHPSVPPALGFDAQRVREYANRRDLPMLQDRVVKCTEDDCWSFTALACLLAGRQGGYRGPTGQSLVFMTFGDVTLGPVEGA